MGKATPVVVDDPNQRLGFKDLTDGMQNMVDGAKDLLTGGLHNVKDGAKDLANQSWCYSFDRRLTDKKICCQNHPDSPICAAGADVDVKEVDDKDSKHDVPPVTGGTPDIVDVDAGVPPGHNTGGDRADVDVSVPPEHTESHQNPLERPVTGGGDGKSGEEDHPDDSTGRLQQAADAWKKLVQDDGIAEKAKNLPAVARKLSDELDVKAANQVDNGLKPKIEGLTRVSLPGSSSADKSSTGLAGKAGEPAKAVEPARAEGSELVEAPAAAGDAPADEVKKGDVVKDVVKTE